MTAGPEGCRSGSWLSGIRCAGGTARAAAGGLACGLWAQRANPVYGARYQHHTSREHNKLRPTQAQTVIAAAILRHLHAVITTGQAWDPVMPTHGTRHNPAALAAWRALPPKLTAGASPPRHRDATAISAHIMGSPPVV